MTIFITETLYIYTGVLHRESFLFLLFVNDKVDVVLNRAALRIATLDLLCELGFQKSNILLVDSKGVINNQRENLTKEKLDYVSTTHKQTLADAS
jgi:malate dehydrogenase (oxaloacetate-decarboxylating)(NADP+)